VGGLAVSGSWGTKECSGKTAMSIRRNNLVKNKKTEVRGITMRLVAYRTEYQEYVDDVQADTEATR